MVSLLFFGCGFISSTLTYLAYFLELTHFRNLNFTRSSEPFFHVLMKIFSMCFTFFVSLISHGFFHTNFSGCSLNISQNFTSVAVWMFSIIFTSVLVQTDHTKIRHYNAIRQCYIIVDQEVSTCNNKYNATPTWPFARTRSTNQMVRAYELCTSLQPQHGQVPSYWEWRPTPSACQVQVAARTWSCNAQVEGEKKCKPPQFVLSACGSGSSKLGRRSWMGSGEELGRRRWSCTSPQPCPQPALPPPPYSQLSSTGV